jgi:hypothetical protein
VALSTVDDTATVLGTACVSVRSIASIAGGVRSPAGLDGERTLLDAKYGTS